MSDVIEDIEITTGGMTFRARAAGPEDGRLVLLLHGFPQTSASWSATLQDLAGDGYRAVAFDQRGYSPGARPDALAAYRLQHLVADVLAVADDIGGHRFDLVGHDWGGYIAWAAAAWHPQRIRSLAIASTPHPIAFAAALRGDLGGDQAQRSWYVDFFRQEGGAAEKALLGDDGKGEQLRGMYAELPPEHADEYVSVLTEPGALTAALNYYRATYFADTPSVGTIDVPTLYVWSTGDTALGREAAEATAASVTGPYRFAELDGVSHWIPDVASEAFDRLLLEHLASVEG
jgi:pimeloyl-ACP methyl ester carboxylesterase